MIYKPLKPNISRISAQLIYFLYKYHYQFILLQCILLALALWIKGGLAYKFFNDAPSYILFNFSSLPEILGGHRTIGLPLVLKLYGLLFKDYSFWPCFQLLLYLSSVFYLYRAFLKFGFSQILSLVVITHLIWEGGVYRAFPYIMTEPLVASFLNLTLGALLYSFYQRNWKSYLALGFSAFALYQIRPNFSVVSLLIPLWASVISFMYDGLNFSRMRRIYLRYVAITVIPLFLFCLLRLVVVGQFGIVAFAGTAMASHATYYLDENNIKQLSGESKILAEEILLYKRKLKFPENLSPFDQRQFLGRSVYAMQNAANVRNCMVAWLAAIKYKTGREPFSDPAKNIFPWEHTQTLSNFFTMYNVEIDKSLMKYANDVLRQVPKQYLSWIIVGTYEVIKDYIKEVSSRRNIKERLWLYFLTVILFVVRPLVFLRRREKKLKYRSWYHGLSLFTMFGLSFFLVGIVSAIMFSSVHARYLDLFVIYLFPAITLWVLPPFWLKRQGYFEKRKE